MIQSHPVEFYSNGIRISGLWRTPEHMTDPPRPIVHGPGWMGLKHSRVYEPYHEKMTQAGMAVLVFDYAGFGDSGGDPTTVSLEGQIGDWINAITYVSSLPDVDNRCVGIFGTGATGGGHALIVGARDERVRAVVSQFPIASGREWLRGMRRDYEWREFLELLDEDRVERVSTGSGKLVNPIGTIMIPTPERDSIGIKADIADEVPQEVSLSLADELLDYRPIDAAKRLQVPLLVIGVEEDATVPWEHPHSIYRAAPTKKSLLMLRGTSHYRSFEKYAAEVIPQIVDWFDSHLIYHNILHKAETRSESE